MTTPHPGTHEYRNQLVRVSELTVIEYMVHDVRFENCQVVGPAVLAVLNNVTFNGCAFDTPSPDALLWRIPPDRQFLTGAVGLLNVEFYACRLVGIGLAIPDADYDRFVDAFPKPQQ